MAANLTHFDAKGVQTGVQVEKGLGFYFSMLEKDIQSHWSKINYIT